MRVLLEGLWLWLGRGFATAQAVALVPAGCRPFTYFQF